MLSEMMQQMFISHILLSAETIKMTTVKVVVVGELPKKPFVDHPVAEMLPEDLRVMQALDRVLRLLSVGSKRFLWLLWLVWLVTSKVDRWVRGLMVRQQCCTCR